MFALLVCLYLWDVFVVRFHQWPGVHRELYEPSYRTYLNYKRIEQLFLDCICVLCEAPGKHVSEMYDTEEFDL